MCSSDLAKSLGRNRMILVVPGAESRSDGSQKPGRRVPGDGLKVDVESRCDRSSLVAILHDVFSGSLMKRH